MRWWFCCPPTTGLWVRNGAEAAVHIVGIYLSNSMRNARYFALGQDTGSCLDAVSCPIGNVSPFPGVFGDHGWKTQVPSLT